MTAAPGGAQAGEGGVGPVEPGDEQQGADRGETTPPTGTEAPGDDHSLGENSSQQEPHETSPSEQTCEEDEDTATPQKRRRSRNRARHRRGFEAEVDTSNDADEDPEVVVSATKDVHRLEPIVPATYGALEAAFFDLDKTVIAKASMVAFGRPFYHGGLINRRTVLRALYGELIYLHLGASEQKLNRIRESVLRLITGWHSDRVREIVAEAIEEIVEPIIFAEAADLIDWHHEQGRLVVIVSASPEEIVTPLSRFLGADECIASKARLDEDGRYTGTMQFYAFGPFKAEAMDALARERGIDLASSYAYTDSYTDLPMLVAVGHPVAVNPDRVLNRFAREHEFEVLHFSQTVSLWSRVRDRLGGVPPRPAIAASAGAAALGFGAAAAGWWLGSRRRAG